MNQFISTLTNFPPEAGSYNGAAALDTLVKQYVTSLNKLGEADKEAVLANPLQVLELIDPATNSIGYLAVLDILLNTKQPAPTTDKGALLDAVLDFLLKFEPWQVRYVGPALVLLLEHVASGNLFSPVVSVELLTRAILRIDPTGSVFTSSHLALANLAYRTNAIEPALKVLDLDITAFPLPRSKDSKPLCDPDLPPSAYISTNGLTGAVKSTSVLEYCFVSALIYMSRRDWAKAQKALEQAISHPTKDKGVSRIMLESYKKWVLVSLLNNGEVSSLPSLTTGSAKHVFGTLAESYGGVAALFVTSNAAQLKAEIEKHGSIWTEDGNESLVAEVASAYQKWQILNLRRIYQRVSISKILDSTFSAETGEPLKSKEAVLALVRGMVESNMLSGNIEQGEGDEDQYLAFRDDDASLTEAQFAREIARCHHSITGLGNDYKVANERLAGNKDYVRHLVREQKRDREDADLALGFDTQVEDEDLMTGVMVHN